MEMRIDTQRIKAERAKRAWSQEHLAEAAGLGLRTIHRIEKSGTASLESVKALAAVFNLDIEQLCPPQSDRNLESASTSLAAIWSGALFTLMVAINFGAMLLDIVYARLLSANPPSDGIAEIFQKVADSLLSLWVWVLLTGIAATIWNWQNKSTRILFLASVGINLLIPLLLVPFVDVTQDTSVSGALFRIFFGAVTTGLVFAGQWKLLSNRHDTLMIGSGR